MSPDENATAKIGPASGGYVHKSIHYYRFSNFRNWFTCKNTDAFACVGCHCVDLVCFILFTAAPVTGSYANMTGNFVYGPGEKLVSGKANPHIFNLPRPKGKYEGPSTLKKIAVNCIK